LFLFDEICLFFREIKAESALLQRIPIKGYLVGFRNFNNDR